MSSNPNASPDTLSETQQQLLTNTQQLQDTQKNLMDRYAATTDPAERTKLVNEMDKIAMLSSNLLSSTGKIALVQNQAITDGRNSAKDMTAITEVMDAQLKDARDKLDAINTSRSEKERMIELNTYYGKRFMAQSGVMKIFIYMCIPVLILAVLANMGFLPNYIAGFMIITAIVIGIVYIYGAVHDINRRDKMNFDEYEWEFDPSRVGPLNPGHGGKHKKKNSNADMSSGCYESACCNPPATIWDPKSSTCVVQSAQGGGSSVQGACTQTTVASTATPTSSSTGFIGNLAAGI
jgi:hypothetical protein